jgi:hypothetical protein
VWEVLTLIEQMWIIVIIIIIIIIIICVQWELGLLRKIELA